MSAATYIAPVAALENTNEPTTQKKIPLLHSKDSKRLTEDVYKRCSICQNEFHNSALHEPANMTLTMQHANNLYINSCKVADRNNESTLINIFLALVDYPTFHSFLNTGPQINKRT